MRVNSGNNADIIKHKLNAVNSDILRGIFLSEHIFVVVACFLSHTAHNAKGTFFRFLFYCALWHSKLDNLIF